ncbi:hypothetical protein MSG28_009094 [Choristoneura fumiferana]|uniref:Uncharacterized protein n=1 Tax=Choristoneura fumiferana TaxID=7141 RepID=A0ACC0KW54_CHOFU|nr:hypothetical protein MSG28_009094 [Choristoneura fumiferana]
MLRALCGLRLERQAVEALAAPRRDVFKVFRTAAPAASLSSAGQTVMMTSAAAPPRAPPAPPAPPAPAAPPPAPPPPPPPRRAWTLAAAVALTASLGGSGARGARRAGAGRGRGGGRAVPSGGGGAAGARGVPGGGRGHGGVRGAARAAGRPPRRRAAARGRRARAALHAPAAQQGAVAAPRPGRRRRRPGAPHLHAVERQAARARLRAAVLLHAGGGAARGRRGRCARARLARHRPGPGGAHGHAGGARPAARRVRYGACLLATGSVPSRLPALAPAAAAGRALTLHTVRDAGRVAALLDDPATQTVAIVGAGLLAAELAAALADRLQGTGKSVVQVYREGAPLQELLPGYLAADAGRRLAAMGVRQLPACEVAGCEVADGGVSLLLAHADGGSSRLRAELVLECVGAAPRVELAAAAGLELHPALGGVVVNAELLARAGVWVAGDAACFHDVLLGRRRVQHHDHAVLSGRRAAANMAGDRAPEPYTHQSMFWSDLGPQLGYEAIGIIDSELPTVGVFSADAVSDAEAAAPAEAAAGAGAAAGAEAGAETPAEARRYERGVVFYLREQRVVGVLLWNLFNRMHVARQVLARGEFDDLFEVAKLFAPHEDD